MGLAKGFLGKTLGLGTGEKGRGLGSCSVVEGVLEMGVVMAELVDEFGEILLVLVGTIEGLGGRGG